MAAAAAWAVLGAVVAAEVLAACHAALAVPALAVGVLVAAGAMALRDVVGREAAGPAQVVAAQVAEPAAVAGPVEVAQHVEEGSILCSVGQLPTLPEAAVTMAAMVRDAMGVRAGLSATVAFTQAVEAAMVAVAAPALAMQALASIQALGMFLGPDLAGR